MYVNPLLLDATDYSPHDLKNMYLHAGTVPCDISAIKAIMRGIRRRHQEESSIIRVWVAKHDVLFAQEVLVGGSV